MYLFTLIVYIEVYVYGFYETQHRFLNPPNLSKPLTWPAETPTLGSGYGFAWVWVALEYPRVTHDNH